MNKSFFAVVFVLAGFTAFAQQLTVAVSPFDIRSGFTKDEAEVIFELFVSELVGAGSLKVVDRNSFDKIMEQMKFQNTDWSDSDKVAQLGKALNANSIIRCVLMKMGEQLIITANILDINTAQILSSSNTRMKNSDEIFTQLPVFVKQLVSKLPKPPPHIFVGRWRCRMTVDNTSHSSSYTGYRSETLTCILDIKENGTIIVEQYDTTFWSRTFDHITSKNRQTYRHLFVKKTYKGTGTYTLRPAQTSGDDTLFMDFTLNISDIDPQFPVYQSAAASIKRANPTAFSRISGSLYNTYYYEGGNPNNFLLNNTYTVFQKI
jgi:TolB-like protein